MRPCGAKIQFFLSRKVGSEIRAKFACDLNELGYVPAQMGPGLQLSQRLTQSLVLAPQLQQSLALLQAPTLELKALVEQELQQNPVLEEVAEPETDCAEKSADSEEERHARRHRSGRAAGGREVRRRHGKSCRPSRWTIFRRNLKSSCRWTRNGATIFPRRTRRSAPPPRTRRSGSSCSTPSRPKRRWRSI